MTKNIEERSKKIWMGSFIVLASLLTLTMIFFSSMFTGNAVFKIPSAYDPGDDVDDEVYLPNPTNPVSLINDTNITYPSNILITSDMAIGEVCENLGYHSDAEVVALLEKEANPGVAIDTIQIDCGRISGQPCCWSSRVQVCWGEGCESGCVYKF